MTTPNTAKDFYDLGMEYFENRNWDLAIANFTSSLNMNGGNADAYHHRGEAHFLKGNYEVAIQNYNRAITIDANRSIFWLHRGWAYHNWAINDPPTMLTKERDFEGRLKRDLNGDIQIVVDAEEVAALNNRAISDINNSLTLDPMNHTTWHNRGWLYLNIGNYPQCIEDCTRAIEIDPRIPWSWNNRGVAYLRLRKWKEAVNDFDQALSIDPNYQLAINNKRDAIRARRTTKVTRFIIGAGVVVAVIVIASLVV